MLGTGTTREELFQRLTSNYNSTYSNNYKNTTTASNIDTGGDHSVYKSYPTSDQFSLDRMKTDTNEPLLSLIITNNGQRMDIFSLPLLIGRVKGTNTINNNIGTGDYAVYDGKTNSVSFNNVFLSRKHAVISQIDESDGIAAAGGFRNSLSPLSPSLHPAFGYKRLKLVDLGSSNGTYVNGKRVPPGPSGIILADDDMIRFGEDDVNTNKQDFTTPHAGEAVRCRISIPKAVAMHKFIVDDPGNFAPEESDTKANTLTTGRLRQLEWQCRFYEYLIMVLVGMVVVVYLWF